MQYSPKYFILGFYESKCFEMNYSYKKMTYSPNKSLTGHVSFTVTQGVQQARDRRFNLFMYFSMVSNRHSSKHRNMVIKRMEYFFFGGGGPKSFYAEPFTRYCGFFGTK